MDGRGGRDVDVKLRTEADNGTVRRRLEGSADERTHHVDPGGAHIGAVVAAAQIAGDLEVPHDDVLAAAAEVDVDVREIVKALRVVAGTAVEVSGQIFGPESVGHQAAVTADNPERPGGSKADDFD